MKRRGEVRRWLSAACRRASLLPLMSAAFLAQPPLLTGRQADFEAFWYFTILGTGMAVLVGVVAVWAFRSVRPMWREGQHFLSLLVLSSAGFFCVFILALILTTLIGLTNHATTPGTGAGTVGR